MRAHIWLTIAMLAALPLAAHAEGEDPDAPAKPKPARHKVVKKPAAPPTGPIPYTTLNPSAAKATAPVATTPLPPPVSIPQPIEVAPPPPPPAAVRVAPQPSPQARGRVTGEPAAEINLKCDTVTNDGKKNLTRGTFYIDLFPSQVFPDQQADFKFDQVDPRHASLVRDSDCLDMTCDARVSGSAYFLVNRVTRKGAALRITLNRATGAYYAEKVDPAGLTHGNGHVGESGWCVPQKLPDVMF